MTDRILAAVQLGAHTWLSRRVPIFQRAILRSNRGPMPTIWRVTYASAARAYGAAVRRGEVRPAVYLRGTMSSGELVPGLTDIDIVVVVAPDAAGPGIARDRVRARMARIARRLPTVVGLLFDWPTVHEEPDLQETTARTILTYGLDDAGAPRRSVYWGPGADVDKQRWLERPELYGRAAAWRRIAGRELRPPEPQPDEAARCVAAWLELQNWWRWAFAACVDPHKPAAAYVGVKLIAEPVRIWLWLTRAEHLPTRREALQRGQVEFPDELDTFGHALELQAALRREPQPATAALTALLPGFVRLSARVARAVEARAAKTGWSEVALERSDGGELALPHGGLDPSTWLRLQEAVPSLVPLVDWRALLAPIEPDDTFALISGDPGDPGVIAATARAIDRGPYPTLSAEGLMVRPAPIGGRSRLRSVHCRATDPASFALAEGAQYARFPRLPGWSIEDLARRGVAEHGEWLRGHVDRDERRGTVLGRLITAARAALIWQSVQEEEPRLPLTVDATMASLGSHVASAGAVAETARQAYHDFASHWKAPPEELIGALRLVLLALPAFAVERPMLRAA